MRHAYAEDQLPELPAIGLFAWLDWCVASQHRHLVPLPGVESAAGSMLVAPAAGKARVAGIVGRETHGEGGWFRDSAGLWTPPTPLLPVEALLIATSQQTGKLAPY